MVFWDALQEEVLAEILCAYGAHLSKKIGFNSQKTSYKAFLKLQDFITKLKKQRKVVEFQLVALDSPLRDLRMIKDTDELQALKKSANLNWKGFEYICSILQEGISEEEVALQFEIFCRTHGAEKLSFSAARNDRAFSPRGWHLAAG